MNTPNKGYELGIALTSNECNAVGVALMHMLRNAPRSLMYGMEPDVRSAMEKVADYQSNGRPREENREALLKMATDNEKLTNYIKENY